MGASVVSCVDAPPVLKSSEHVFDLVSLTIERAIVRVLNFAGSMGRNAGSDAALGERFSEPARIIAPVAEHGFGRRQGIDQHGRALVIAGLPFGQDQADGPAATVAYGMELGSQAAAAASDTSG